MLLVLWPILMFLSIYSTHDLFCENHFNHLLNCVSNTDLGGGIMNINKGIFLTKVISYSHCGGTEEI